MAQKEKYIRQRPDGRWEVRMKIGVYSDGKTYAPSRYFASRADARAYVQRVLAERTEKVVSRLTLIEWADRAEEIYGASLQDHTVMNLRVMKRNFLQSYPLAAMKLDEVKKADVQLWMARLKRKDGKPYAPSSVLAALGYIKWLFSKAVESEQISSMPNLKSLHQPKRSKPRIESVLTPDAAQAILNASKGHRMHNALVLDSLSGLRRSELLGLKWSDINMDTGEYAIRRKLTCDKDTGETKLADVLKTASASRVGRFPPTAVAALRDQRRQVLEDRLKVGQFYEDNDLVFANPYGLPLNPQSFTVYCYRVSQEAIGRKVGPHAFRHMVATLLIRAHLDDMTIANAMGHSSANFTRDQYAEFYADSRDLTADVLEQYGKNWVESGSN